MNTHEYDTSPKEPNGLIATNTNIHTNRLHCTNNRGWAATHSAGGGGSAHHVKKHLDLHNNNIFWGRYPTGYSQHNTPNSAVPYRVQPAQHPQ